MKQYDVALILLTLILVGGCVDSSKQSDTNTPLTNKNSDSDKILKSDLELLPTGKELPTEYPRNEPYQINLTKDGFVSGMAYETQKPEGTAGATVITFEEYRFDTPSSASTYYDTFVKDIEEGGGYTQLSVATNAKCFSYKEDYGFEQRTGTSICLRKNIAFVTEVLSLNSLTNVDSVTKEMTKLFDSKVN